MCNDLRNEIKAIIAKVLGVNSDDVHEEFSPNYVDNWDSMNHMRIILEVESKYGIKFDANQITGMMNLKDIYATVSTQL